MVVWGILGWIQPTKNLKIQSNHANTFSRGVGRMGGWLVVLVGSLMYLRVDTVNPLEGGMAQRLLSQRDELVQVEVYFFI